MKSRHISYIVILILIIAVIGFLTGTDATAKKITGQITALGENNETITVTTDSGTSTTATINDRTTVVDTDGSTTTASMLDIGYLVEMTATVGEESTAERIKIVSQPPVLAHSPTPAQEVTSPLSVSGKALGTWFFEVNMTVRLENSKGETIARKGIQADGEWMTENYVPFSGTISFSKASVTPGIPSTNSTSSLQTISGQATGKLVFEKANPSGLPENADSFAIPVVFSEGENADAQTMNVEVYFRKDIVGTDVIECDAVFKTTRTVEKTKAVARAALEELLAGPTEKEKTQKRLITNIPEGVTIQSLRVENGTAYADFSEELDKNVGGSCRVTAIRKQIEKTLKQFSTVDDVVISINGKTETILQP